MGKSTEKFVKNEKSSTIKNMIIGLMYDNQTIVILITG
jgi:hypothetical protein